MDKHLWGLNPNLKEFMEKKPGLTLIGLGWASYWRLAIIIFGLEMLFFFVIIVLGFVAGR